MCISYFAKAENNWTRYTGSGNSNRKQKVSSTRVLVAALLHVNAMGFINYEYGLGLT